MLAEVLAAYRFPATLLGAVRYGRGHINDTFCVICQPQEGDCIRYILQGLSPAAFPRPTELMENFVGITTFLRRKIIAAGGDPTRETLRLVKTRDGRLPLRVTHNDAKLNNVLFDRTTGEGLCVIDLDTTMPGLSINAFGDSIRFGANHAREDEKDLSKVCFDMALFDVYTRGFLEGARGSLTGAELELLPWGARLMTLECGIRFLTDYLCGDRYFRTQYPGQNLDRCRTQLKLVHDTETQFDAMSAVVFRYSK